MQEISKNKLDYDSIVKILSDMGIVLIFDGKRFEIGEEISIDTVGEIVNNAITKLKSL